MRHAGFVLILAVLAAAPAGAQEEADKYRTAVSVVGGLSVGGDGHDLGRLGRVIGDVHGGGTAFAVGGGIAHDLTSRLTLEANGLYLDRGASAWSADAGLRFNLVPSREDLVPYFAVSGGLYGQSTESFADDLARVPRGIPGGRFGGRGGFRGDDGFGGGDGIESRGATDGMLTLGGGVRFSAGPHVFVRPDARAQIVFSGDSRVFGLFTLNFGYRF
jgi:hypothetical protein